MIRTLLNSLANWLKVALILTSDLINRVFDPYENFDRPEEPKYSELLYEKAAKFDVDMDYFFWDKHGIYRYKLPTDSGDQCIWHGIYTAMIALKTSVTRNDYSRLLKCLEGMESFIYPTGENIPRLIRGWREDGTYEDSVSNDQASGFLAGAYFGWKYGNADCREQAKLLITGLADELSIYNNCLINVDKTPTKHGRLENGYLTDPLNLTLCLAIYAVAYRITGEPLYKVRYDELVKKYCPMIPYGNAKLWLTRFLVLEKTHHAHRAAIHYSILCDLEPNHDLNRLYLKGLLRIWMMERKSGNPWIYFLMRRVCLFDPSHIDACRKHLMEFTLEDKQYNAEKINSNHVKTFKWGKHIRARQPLARWRVGSQDFFWQRHLYSVDDWIGNQTGNVRHNGGDFLIAYWGLRSLRLLGATE